MRLKRTVFAALLLVMQTAVTAAAQLKGGIRWRLGYEARGDGSGRLALAGQRRDHRL